MANILINGLNSKTGGGKSILNNYLSILIANGNSNKYYVLTPNKNEYEKYSNDFIEVIEINSFYLKSFLFPYVYRFIIPGILKKLNIKVVFNLADIPIVTQISQVFLFDWSYAVYPKSIVWERMDLKSWFSRKVKLFYFKKNLKYISTMVAQTNTMKKRLERLYEIENIYVIPNSVSLENIIAGELYDFKLPKGRIKLLYLTYYYPHKNLEIFISIAKKIKQLSLPYCLVTTISETQHKKAKEFINSIKDEGLEDIIINLGPVEMKNVPSVYIQCDALLMPTLLESFSGTYVEAMHHKKTILTSNLDFATDVCGDAAFYFNPLDEISILNTINIAFNDSDLRLQKIEKGINKLSHLLNWEQAFIRYQDLIERSIK